MFQTDWPHYSWDRPGYFKPNTHQTLIGKALFEHSLKCSTVAAVAGVSPNFRNSSLGPNLLALVEVNDKNQDLFLKIFFSSLNSTLQFTNALFVDQRYHPEIGDLLVQNLCQTNYFGKNDLNLKLFCPFPSVVSNLLRNCQKIVSLTIELTYRSRLRDQVDFFSLEHSFRFFDGSRLKTLSLNLGEYVPNASTVFKILYEQSPNLEELSIETSVRFAGSIFSILTLQDIQSDTNNNNTKNTTTNNDVANNTIQTHHPHLASLSLKLDTSSGMFDHSAFQNIFCGVLLQQDQLHHLSLDFYYLLNEDDWNAFNVLTFNNLTMNESPWGFLPRQCLGNSNFDDLKVVEVEDFSDDELLLLGNQCLLMEDLKIDFDDGADCVGAFLSDPSLVPKAFGQVRAFLVNCENFTTDSLGDGFSRFTSLEKLTLEFAAQPQIVAAFFQHLPHPHLLKRLEIFDPSSDAIADDLFSTHVSKFSNLDAFIFASAGEELEICENEILSLANLKNLKEITLEFDSFGGRAYSSSSIIRLVEQLPNLSTLHFNRCCNFTEESVKKLLAHRSLQDLSVDPVLMPQSDCKNKTDRELLSEAYDKQETLKQFVRENYSHVSTFKCSVSTSKFC